MLKNCVLFTLSANQELGKKVAAALGMELSPVSVKRFPSGEIIAESIETVRGKMFISFNLHAHQLMKILWSY